MAPRVAIAIVALLLGAVIGGLVVGAVARAARSDDEVRHNRRIDALAALAERGGVPAWQVARTILNPGWRAPRPPGPDATATLVLRPGAVPPVRPRPSARDRRGS